MTRLVGYLAAEEEDPGEAGGADAAPDDHRGGEQGPVAVDHPRPLARSLLLLPSLIASSPEDWIGRDRRRERLRIWGKRKKKKVLEGF